jgi:hypothetical protein
MRELPAKSFPLRSFARKWEFLERKGIVQPLAW